MKQANYKLRLKTFPQTTDVGIFLDHSRCKKFALSDKSTRLYSYNSLYVKHKILDFAKQIS